MQHILRKMSKKYIQRELLLKELGYDLNCDVQVYIEYVQSLIGDPNNLTKSKIKILHYDGYVYLKDGVKILFYNEKNNDFWVDKDYIWDKFTSKFNISENEIVGDLLAVILEHIFEIKVYTSSAKAVSKVYSLLLKLYIYV